MSSWLSNLVLGSTGLLLSTLVASFVLRAWQRRPVAAYRLSVAVLAAGLILPAAQIVARYLGTPLAHPVAAWVDGLRAGEPQSPTASTAVPAVEALDRDESPSAGVGPALLALLLLGQEAGREVIAPDHPAGAPAAQGQWRWTSVLACLYALGLLASLAMTARRLHGARVLLRSSRAVTAPRTLAVWREVAARSPVGSRARLVESPLLRAPACFGLGRPVVVLPSPDALEQRPEMLACVITHELVHLERRDAWVQLGEELLRALFWFHPAAWWLIARLERLREVSCDLLVVRRTGKRRRYAAALVEYAAWMQAGALGTGQRTGQAAAVLPWSASKGQLARRIEMLLKNEPSSSPVARFAAPTAVGILFSFLWSGQLALAASSAPGAKAGDAGPAAAACDPAHEDCKCKAVKVVRVESDGRIEVSPDCKVIAKVVTADVQPCAEAVTANAVEEADPLLVVTNGDGSYAYTVGGGTLLAAGVYCHDPKSGELRAVEPGADHAPHQDADKKGGKAGQKGKRRVFVLNEETGKLIEVGGKGGVREYGHGGSLELHHTQLAELEELGQKLRDQAEKYYRTVEPEAFAADLERALAGLKSAEASGAIGEEVSKKVGVYRGLLDKGEYKQAIEHAHKALKKLSDVELARKLSETTQAGTQAQLNQLYGRLGRTDHAQAHGQGGSAEGAEIDTLRREVMETRALLDRQRAEIEELRKALEELSSRSDHGVGVR